MSKVLRFFWVYRILWIPLLVLFDLAQTLWWTRGHFHPEELRTFTLIFSVFTLHLFFPLGPARKAAGWPGVTVIRTVLLVAILFSLHFTLQTHRLLYLERAWVDRVLNMTSALCAAALLGILLFQNRVRRVSLERVLWGVLGVLLIQKVLVVLGSPSPKIDVFFIDTQAVKNFLAGINPYGAAYSDIYQGAYGYAPNYVYLPVTLLVQTLGWGLGGDIRYGLILADIVGGWGLYELMKSQGLGRSERVLGLLLWFVFPIQNFMLEQAWVDPIMAAATIWAFRFLHGRNFLALGLALGVCCASKQYGLLLATGMVFWVFVDRKMGEAIKLGLVTFLVAGILCMPFALWNTQSFFDATVTGLLSQGFRSDSFSWPAYLVRLDYSPQLWWHLLPPLLAMTAGTWLILFHRANPVLAVASGCFVIYTTTFLWGRQAFCNYYYLSALFLCLYVLSLCSILLRRMG